MHAKRSLRGKRPEEERVAARRAVQDAKQALGERGPVWWQTELLTMTGEEHSVTRVASIGQKARDEWIKKSPRHRLRVLAMRVV